MDGSISELRLGLQEFSQIRIALRSSPGQCVRDLLKGNVHAVSTDDVILAGFASQHRKELRLLNAPFRAEKYGVGMARGESALRHAVCESLQRYVSSGDWQRSYKKHLTPLGLLAPKPATCGDAKKVPQE